MKQENEIMTHLHDLSIIIYQSMCQQTRFSYLADTGAVKTQTSLHICSLARAFVAHIHSEDVNEDPV